MASERGFSLVELVAILAVAGIALSVATVYWSPNYHDLDKSLEETRRILQTSRMQAIASGGAYRVRAASSSRVVAESAASCAGGSWIADDRLDFKLPTGISVSTGWSACFNRQGTATGYVPVSLTHAVEGTRQLEVLLSGTTRILP